MRGVPYCWNFLDSFGDHPWVSRWFDSEHYFCFVVVRQYHEHVTCNSTNNSFASFAINGLKMYIPDMTPVLRHGHFPHWQIKSKF